MEPFVTCPKCQTEIKLTETLAAPLIAQIRGESDAKLRQKDLDIAKREAEVRAGNAALLKAREAVEDEVAAKLAAGHEKAAADAMKKARAAISLDMAQKAQELDEIKVLLNEREVKLAEAQRMQADMVRKERELQDQKREMDLTVEKRVKASESEVRARAKKEAEAELGLKVQEGQLTIQSMQRQIEDLKRRSEQGSQQLQGEVLELELEALLRSAFPHDAISPVAKGASGADILQEVMTPYGEKCGRILWETKRTRNWSDGWLAKLREDQRGANADAAIIVSRALPKTVETFGHVEGVWVAGPQCAVPVATAVRHMLIQVTGAHAKAQGQQTKAELVYRYLSGPGFRHRVDSMVEKSKLLRDDLQKERLAMQKLWARREQQIQGLMESMAGMYGDLQGIAGRSLQEIEGLEFGDEAATLAGSQKRTRRLQYEGGEDSAL